MTAVRELCPHSPCVLYIEGRLRAPVNGEPSHSVRALLRNGQRRIVLDLARVSGIDAAGVGELVRAYNMTTAVSGVLQIVHATAWVREILERVGLFELLRADGSANLQRSSLTGVFAGTARAVVHPR